MKLDETDLKILDQVKKITLTDYGIKRYTDLKEGYIEHDGLISVIEDLLSEIDHLQEKVDDLEEQLEEGLITDPYDYFGVSEHEFY